MHHLSTVEALYQIHIVFLLGILTLKSGIVQISCMVIRFLNATSGRGIVTGDSQAYHGTVGQVDGALYQAFTECTTAYNNSSVPVLYGTGNDFTGRGRVFIHQYNETAVFEVTRAFGVEITTLGGSSFGIYNQFFLLQELIGKIDGCVQVSASITLQVEY